MNKKEYKTRLEYSIVYSGYDYLSESERKELYHELKKVEGIRLDGFNNRAIIKPVENGYILQSYETDVCSYIDGSFKKLWEGYSNTTLKHVNLFCEWLNIPGYDKYGWVMLDTEV